MAGSALRRTSTVIGSAAISVASYGDDDFARLGDMRFVALKQQGGRGALLDDGRPRYLRARRQRFAMVDGAARGPSRRAEMDVARGDRLCRAARGGEVEFHLGPPADRAGAHVHDFDRAPLGALAVMALME